MNVSGKIKDQNLNLPGIVQLLLWFTTGWMALMIPCQVFVSLLLRPDWSWVLPSLLFSAGCFFPETKMGTVWSWLLASI